MSEEDEETGKLVSVSLRAVCKWHKLYFFKWKVGWTAEFLKTIEWVHQLTWNR